MSTGTLGHWHARARRQEGDRRPPRASRTHTRRAVRGRRLCTCVLRSSDVRDGDGGNDSEGGLLGDWENEIDNEQEALSNTATLTAAGRKRDCRQTHTQTRTVRRRGRLQSASPKWEKARRKRGRRSHLTLLRT